MAEILSQPRCWEDCFNAFDEQDSLGKVLQQFGRQTDWLFLGCGSSYYIAQVAAASWTRLTGLQARAMPASDLLLFPDLALSPSKPCQPILISRSGHTSEILKAAEFLETTKNIRTLAISCVNGQPLEKIATATIYELPADEKSMVMTRSFSSMLLGLQSLAAMHSNQSSFTAALRKLPQLAQSALDSQPQRIRDFVESHHFADYVFLGQGPYFGVANEAMLKITEMSCSYAQCFHTLEFRHGPKSIVSPETLVTFLLSETGYEAEREVLEEVKGLGGVTLAVTNRADAATRRAADLIVELNLDLPEYARLAAYVFTGQLLGLMTGLKKGLDPDRPRNLTRAVILNG
ncbi:MAG TPA: SIS domain-containing protein [Terriglobia bacterium]|nr:SIS domain-containing protein [Terriglobia bacterium]